jgi:ABC-2 type transport system permease protein
MLWYKAWLETRARFLVSLIGASVLCPSVVYQLDRSDMAMHAKPGNLPAGLFLGHSFLVIIWIVAVTLLMMGGLLREKSNGSSGFTLALPVKRLELMSARIGVGLAQAIALAIVPWSAMLFVQQVVGKTYALPQAIFHIGLLLSGGVLFVAIAFLTSSLLDGEYTAPSACFVAFIALAHALNGRGYNPWDFILGSDYLHMNNSELLGSFPWRLALVFVLSGAILIVVSIRSVEKRDF